MRHAEEGNVGHVSYCSLCRLAGSVALRDAKAIQTRNLADIRQPLLYTHWESEIGNTTDTGGEQEYRGTTACLTQVCCLAETVSTLKFAHRAKSVRNTAHVNEDADQRTLLRKYEQELRKLRAELQMRQREVVDKRHLLAVSLPKPMSSGIQDVSADLWTSARRCARISRSCASSMQAADASDGTFWDMSPSC